MGIRKIESPPASIARSAMTIAKIGRSMKNLDMAPVLAYFAEETTVPGEVRGTFRTVVGVAPLAVGAGGAAMADVDVAVVGAAGVAAVGAEEAAASDAGCTSTAWTITPGFTFCTPVTMTRSASLIPRV